MSVIKVAISLLVSSLTAAAYGNTIIIQQVSSQSPTFQPTRFDDVSISNSKVENELKDVTSDHYLRLSSSSEVGIVRNGGWLEIQSAKSSASNSYDSSAQIASSATWDDYLTVTTPDATQFGKSAILKMQLELHGKSTAFSNSSIGGIGSRVEFGFFTNSIGQLSWAQNVSQSGTEPVIVETTTPFGSREKLSGIYDLEIPVIIGEPLYFSLSIQGGVSGRAVGGGFASGAYVYDKSLYWGGVQSLQINGTESSEFFITSSSGQSLKDSFVSQVPEPDSGYLAALGLGVIFAINKKYRSRLRHNNFNSTK